MTLSPRNGNGSSIRKGGGGGDDYFERGDGTDTILDFVPEEGERKTTDCETVVRK